MTLYIFSSVKLTFFVRISSCISLRRGIFNGFFIFTFPTHLVVNTVYMILTSPN